MITLVLKNGLTANLAQGVWRSSNAQLETMLNQLTRMTLTNLSPSDGSPTIILLNTIQQHLSPLIKSLTTPSAKNPADHVLY